MRLFRTKFRSAVFRNFQEWYCKNSQRFLMPLHLIKTRNDSIELTVGEINFSVMTILIKQFKKSRKLECSVNFFFKNQCIDSMCWLSTTPLRQGKNYICEECINGSYAKKFKSLEMLWHEHIFESLIDWVNTTLAPMAYIAFYQNFGCTWVKLHPTCTNAESNKYLLASYEIH